MHGGEFVRLACYCSSIQLYNSSDLLRSDDILYILLPVTGKFGHQILESLGNSKI